MRANAMALIASLSLLSACGGQPVGEPKAPNSAARSVNITDREWVLVALGDKTAPFGPQQKPPTLRLNAADSRAAGFAGCNQYSSRYTLRADSLKFESPGATKMFCTAAADLENAFLRMLPEVVTYQASDSVLTLTTQSGTVARFHAAR